MVRGRVFARPVGCVEFARDGAGKGAPLRDLYAGAAIIVLEPAPRNRYRVSVPTVDGSGFEEGYISRNGVELYRNGERIEYQDAFIYCDEPGGELID